MKYLIHKKQAQQICNRPFHDNQQTFAIVERVLIDVNDLHNMITHGRPIMQVHFSACLRHI